MLTQDATLINKNAEDEGWIFRLKISDQSQIKKLMSFSDYEEFLKKD